ncbi:hypothetical protein ACFYXM_34280 [Streptomyces sp. NPDC002476]|uniref:hypothetical protein n=1 Tax=Streptomyces sp. NPDC002476 TaxID=3364648 RepID=UPI0036C3EB45
MPRSGVGRPAWARWSPRSAARSSKAPDSFEALFTAAAEDPAAAEHVRDLFAYALEWTQDKAANSVNPQSLGKAICSALTEHGPSHWPWKRPKG